MPPRDKARGLKAHDIAAAMNAVTSALADHAGRGGEDRAGVDTFVWAIDASDFDWRPRGLEDASKARGAARIAESGSPWIYNR